MFLFHIHLCCSHCQSCRRAALTVARVVTNIRHSSHPSHASCPVCCCVASSYTVISYLLVPLIAPLSLVPLIPLIVASLHFSHRRLPSASASTSHCAVALITLLLGPLSDWLRYHLSSRRHHLSAGSSEAVSKAD